jgi:hypothetical protein
MAFVQGHFFNVALALPWTARSYNVFDEFGPVRNGAPIGLSASFATKHANTSVRAPTSEPSEAVVSVGSTDPIADKANRGALAEWQARVAEVALPVLSLQPRRRDAPTAVPPGGAPGSWASTDERVLRTRQSHAV